MIKPKVFTIVVFIFLGFIFLVLRNATSGYRDFDPTEDKIRTNSFLLNKYDQFCDINLLRSIKDLHLEPDSNACEEYVKKLRGSESISFAKTDEYGFPMRMSKKGLDIYFFSVGEDGIAHTCDDKTFNGSHPIKGFCFSDLFSNKRNQQLENIDSLRR